MKEIERLKYVLALYDAAARKFVAKVESGRAQSKETYEDLRDALGKSEAYQREVQP